MERHSRTVLFTCGLALGIGATLAAQRLLAATPRRHRGRRSRSHSILLRSVSLTTTEEEEEEEEEEEGKEGKEGKEDIRDGLEECIGNTPLIRIKSLSEATGCEILGKAEFLEPGGSIKDRVALKILRAAEAAGQLRPRSGDKVYEGTVGSTGVSLAGLARARGYQAHICMPSDQSAEKASLLEKLGATVERVAPAAIVDPRQFVNLARERAAEHARSPDLPGNGFFADQFENEANWLAHHDGTAPEILRQCGGRGRGLDAFVAGAGTGGTVSGVAKYLKPRLPGLRVVLADPPGSGLYNWVRYGVMFDPKEREGTRRRHQVDTIVEGIGINRVTRNFEVGRDLVDDAVRVTDREALAMARFLVEKDGLFVGSSSAVNCVAAVRTALAMGPGHRVVTVLCDSGSRHLSKFWARAGNVGGGWDMTIEDVLEAEERAGFEEEEIKTNGVEGVVERAERVEGVKGSGES